MKMETLSFSSFASMYGNNVWVAELEDDYMTIKTETMRPCIHVSQAWEEVWPRVNEGSYVLKHNGLYYMTYSGNSFESHSMGSDVHRYGYHGGMDQISGKSDFAETGEFAGSGA